MNSLLASSQVCLAMLAFAGNSILCRLALQDSANDPLLFTVVRLATGACCLAVIVSLRNRPSNNEHGLSSGSWPSAAALLAYAIGFSIAYRSLSAGTGALLLFAAVQATMIGVGVWRGERLTLVQILGLILAAAGLLVLVLPGIERPSTHGAALMALAGVAWGVYSLRGRTAVNPIAVTAGNFWRAALVASLLMLILYASRGQGTVINPMGLTPMGVLWASISGALASGVGYAIWYSVLPKVPATYAATVQLSVPVIASVAGVLLLAEPLTVRLALAGLAILSGIGLVVTHREKATTTATMQTKQEVAD